MPNAFMHVHFYAENLAAAKRFYGQLFDWQLLDIDGSGGNDAVIEGAGVGGGMTQNPWPELPMHWLPFVEVEDVRAVLEQVLALSGRIVVDATELPGQGWYGIMIDPWGGRLGVWQPPAPISRPTEEKQTVRRAGKRGAARSSSTARSRRG
jgi:uncharacterized protein